jgi:cyanophycinase-like exopeptidase
MVGTEGPVALVGSGEFLEVMVPVDAALLAGRPARAAILPTAAGLESDERVAWWLDLARRHYEAMGVEPVPVPVRHRADAEDRGLAALIDGVGLVYLSGGDPHHLATTLRGSRVWDAIQAAWHGGAAVAGCSAGAMALTSGAPPDLGPGGTHRSRPDDRSPGATTDGDGDGAGLGLVGHLAVIPHYDLPERRSPGIVERFSRWQPPATTLVGVEEETALVSTGPGWRVHGTGAVWVFGPGDPQRYVDGEDVALAPPAP